jgi:parallel beta-helix repeat protein
MSLVIAKVGVDRKDLVFQSSLSTTDTRVTAIVGNTISFSPAFNITGTFGSGSVLVNSFIPIMHASGTTLSGGTIDGNRTNRPWARWETDYATEFPIGSAGSTIRDMIIQNMPGEGVGWFGDGHRCLSSRFLTLGGNGVHFSAAVHPLVDGCWFDDGNLDLAVGHVDGAVSWSNGITHATIVNNYMTGFKSGIGSFDNTNTDATVSNNTITGNKVWGVYVAAGAARLVLTGNRITNNNADPSLVSGLGYANTGGVLLHAVSSTDYMIVGNQIEDAAANYCLYATGIGGSVKRCSITGNQIVGHVLFGAIKNLIFANNSVKGKIQVSFMTGLQFVGNDVDLDGDTTSLAVSLYATGAYINCAFFGNTISGGSYGFNIGTAATSLVGVSFKNNVLYNQANRGFSVTNTTATLSGLTISENTIVAGPASLSSFNGIVANPAGISLSNNEISEASGTAGTKVAINYTAGSGAGAGGVIKDNIVRGAWSNAIALVANAGAWAINNVVDSGTVGSATGNTISGTVTI